jgi:hypothetical protein
MLQLIGRAMESLSAYLPRSMNGALWFTTLNPWRRGERVMANKISSKRQKDAEIFVDNKKDFLGSYYL